MRRPSADGDHLAALRARMMELYERPEAHAEWQRASADYYALLHPSESEWRTPPPRLPSVEEIGERARRLAKATRQVPQFGRLDPRPGKRAEWSASVGWFYEMVAAMYPAAFSEAMHLVSKGDEVGVEYLLRFLEADPWCFRSGYLKADAIRVLKRVPLSPEARHRLAAVVLKVVHDPRHRREFRSYGALARLVASVELEQALKNVVDTGVGPQRLHARWMLEAIGQPTNLAPSQG